MDLKVVERSAMNNLFLFKQKLPPSFAIAVQDLGGKRRITLYENHQRSVETLCIVDQLFLTKVSCFIEMAKSALNRSSLRNE